MPEYHLHAIQAVPPVKKKPKYIREPCRGLALERSKLENKKDSSYILIELNIAALEIFIPIH